MGDFSNIHDTDNNDQVTNDDWMTTCLIYNQEEEEDASSTRTTFQRFQNKSDGDDNSTLDKLFGQDSLSSLTCNKANHTAFSVALASIELPILATQNTIFAVPEALQTGNYRFWMLPKIGGEHQQNPPLCLKLSFLYSEEDEEEEKGNNDDYDGYGDDDNQGFPIAVSVSLVSPFPETWPNDEEQPWLQWLQKQANTVLQEQLTSYAVCEFMDHNALDYFRTVQLEEEGILMVIFSQPAVTHWQATVDSLVLNPLFAARTGTMVRHFANGTRKIVLYEDLWPRNRKDNKHARQQQQRQQQQEEWPWLHPCILRHEKWFPRSCPICLDDTFVAAKMLRLGCSHYVCKDCFTTYASVQVQDIDRYRLQDNPFKCPFTDCRQGLQIFGVVRDYLSEAEMEKVRSWYWNLKHPVSRFVPKCLTCGGQMRKRGGVDDYCIMCDSCDVQRCEYCLEKIKKGDDEYRLEHLSTHCKGAETLKFARRYWRATPELQQKCRERYPWIHAYAEARVGSALAIREWLSKKEGQVCPVCSNGVVRDEGCFHIHCSCGAHFCYECGEELFPPYYGTHHCWENG